MDEREALTSMWPLFGLAVRTPRLELRYPTDADLGALAALTGDIHDPGFLPFNQPWSLAPDEERHRGTLQFHWRARAELTPDHWQVPLVAVVDGSVAGTQELLAKGFAVRRTVTSGSWLHRPRQGQGLGREMREAVLHLAFAGLGAQRAETEAFDGNEASMAVSRAVGYRPNGDFVHDGGELGPRTGQSFTLERATWEPRRRADIELVGVDACRPLLGA